MRCHFCFAGPVQLVRCDVCSPRVLTVKLCTANYIANCHRSRDIAGLCCALALPVLNMRHSVQAVLAQRNKNGSAQVHKNQMSIATISVLVL